MECWLVSLLEYGSGENKMQENYPVGVWFTREAAIAHADEVTNRTGSVAGVTMVPLCDDGEIDICLPDTLGWFYKSGGARVQKALELNRARRKSERANKALLRAMQEADRSAYEVLTNRADVLSLAEKGLRGQIRRLSKMRACGDVKVGALIGMQLKAETRIEQLQDFCAEIDATMESVNETGEKRLDALGACQDELPLVLAAQQENAAERAACAQKERG